METKKLKVPKPNQNIKGSALTQGGQIAGFAQVKGLGKVWGGSQDLQAHKGAVG